MTRYSYGAIDSDGNNVSGVESGASAGAVHFSLLERGLQPFNVVEKRSILQFEITKKRVPKKVIMHFSRQLAVFARAGIPILSALEVINEETTDKSFKKALEDMVAALQAGDTFAAAAAAHPEAFPPYYIGILNSAELTGALDTVLSQLADYLERDEDAKSRLTGALVYPAVVMVMALVTVLVLTVFVLPRFEVFFKSLNATLPLPTRMLLAFTRDVTTYWYGVVGGMAFIIIGTISSWRSKRGRRHMDALLLKIPVLGDLIVHALLERICRILASMIGAGVGLPESMAVTAQATSNAVYREGLSKIRLEMLEGRGLSEPLAASGLFPGAARQIFRVGEETGTLDEQLTTAAAYYDREVDFKIKRFTSLFEPLVIIVVGVVVGFVAVALISAMYGVYRQVKV